MEFGSGSNWMTPLAGAMSPRGVKGFVGFRRFRLLGGGVGNLGTPFSEKQSRKLKNTKIPKKESGLGDLFVFSDQVCSCLFFVSTPNFQNRWPHEAKNPKKHAIGQRCERLFVKQVGRRIFFKIKRQKVLVDFPQSSRFVSFRFMCFFFFLFFEGYPTKRAKQLRKW